MLRIGGLIAFLASAVLSVVLFSRVYALKFSAEAWNSGSPPMHLRLDTGPKTPVLLSWKTPYSLSLSVASDDRNRVVDLTVDEEYEAVRAIPDDAKVVVMHRGVEWRSMRWGLGSTVIESEGGTYVLDRSPGRFFWSLGLISAVPVLCWGAAAVLTVLLRQPHRGVSRAT
jgi:hypothetical protein